MSKIQKPRPQTTLVHGGTVRSQFEETSEAIFLTSGFISKTGEEAAEKFADSLNNFTYSRVGNPSVRMLEDRMAAYEGADFCFATTTGMSAITSLLLCYLSAGDRLVLPYALFGSSVSIANNILPRLGIEVVWVDGTDLDQWEKALSKPTQLVLLETPSNPTLQIIDLEQVCKLAHHADALVAVDNVFATAVLQKPFEFGADFVLYSTTKYTDGQGRVMGGAILGGQEHVEKLHRFLRATGPTLSPFNAWVLLKGLETLELRVHQQTDNALTLAQFLEQHDRVTNLYYPALKSHPQHELAMKQMSGKGGPLITFDVIGGKEDAFALMNKLHYIKISNNLGGSISLITHPKTTTHSLISEDEQKRGGVYDGTLRISVGLEAVDDLKEDIEQALSF